MWKKSIDKGSLHPEFLSVIEMTLRILESMKTPFKVYSGLRSFAEQDALYAKGRTAPGNMVTKARGGQSMHNYGLAVDLAPLNLMTPEDWDVHWPDITSVRGDVWRNLEQALEEAQILSDGDLTFEWGGRWRFRDLPHCQIRITSGELRSGYYPPSKDAEWLVFAHTTFLYDSDWMKRRVQALLNHLGYKAGVVDGIHGMRTKDAISAFQKERSPIASGHADQRTVEQLVRDCQGA